MTATSTAVDLVDAVKKHATEHYTDGGWDVVIEAWSDEQIAETIGKARTPKTAIAKVAEIVGVYADRQADAEVEGADPGAADDVASEARIEASLVTLAGALIGAQIPRAAEATVRKTLDKIGVDADARPTAEQADRLVARKDGRAKAGLTGPAAIEWIVTGQNAKEQAATAKAKTPAAAAASKPKSTRKATSRAAAGDVSQADVDAARLGTEAAAAKGKPLSQKVTPRETAKARDAIVAAINEAKEAGRFPNAQAISETRAAIATLGVSALGFKSEKAMRAYVDGRETGDETSKAGVRRVKEAIASHQCWARKAGAAAFGVILEAKTGK